MDSNHRKNTLTELQSVPFSHSGTPPVFFITTRSFCVLVKECAKVIVFFIMSKPVPKKNEKKTRKGGRETGGRNKISKFSLLPFSLPPYLLFSYLPSSSGYNLMPKLNPPTFGPLPS
jgi:hypothetical protein